MATRTTGGPGRLVLVATPIGNLEDLSPRAARLLAEADLVAAEDTRRTRVLLEHIGARPPMTSYHEHNEDRRTAALLDRVAAGALVVAVTDAGTPGIADPGFRLAAAAADRGLRVEAVPGPSALLHALVVSGLPTDRFAFEGFLPRRPGDRRRRLEALAGDERTLVFYVTPHRAAADLAALAAAFGAQRPTALCRELTKLYEEVRRGSLAELAAEAERAAPRGEVTVVVAGAPRAAPQEVAPDELARRVRALIAEGEDRKAAIAAVAAATGQPRREVYAAAVARPPT